MKRLALTLCPLVLVLVLFASCNTQPPHNPANTSVAAPAPGTFATINVDRFDEMTRQPGVVILDVRTPDEFAQGHVKVAINIDSGSADFAQKIAALDKGQTYIVNCRSGRRSAQACTQMASTGFTRLYNLDGGINAWTNANKPVEK